MEYSSSDIKNNINNGFVSSKKKFSRMYYIWCDESDENGKKKRRIGQIAG